MNNKGNHYVYNALLTIFKIMGYPMSVYSDDDGAFKSKVKELFESEGINHITTLTHANVAERFIRTLKMCIHDRVIFTSGNWEDMIKHVVIKYNNTSHSSTKHTPKEAHSDKQSPDVAVSLTATGIQKRTYNNINVGDDVKVYTKGTYNYTSRKQYNSKLSDTTYKVVSIDRDITFNKYYGLDGFKQKHYHRHELLLIY